MTKEKALPDTEKVWFEYKDKPVRVIGPACIRRYKAGMFMSDPERLINALRRLNTQGEWKSSELHVAPCDTRFECDKEYTITCWFKDADGEVTFTVITRKSRP